MYFLKSLSGTQRTTLIFLMVICQLLTRKLRNHKGEMVNSVHKHAHMEGRGSDTRNSRWTTLLIEQNRFRDEIFFIIVFIPLTSSLLRNQISHQDRKNSAIYWSSYCFLTGDTYSIMRSTWAIIQYIWLSSSSENVVLFFYL